MRTHEAQIVLELGEPAARIVADALAPETGGLGGEVPKTSARVEAADGRLVLRLAADDGASLRAVVNSYLRWTRAALDVASPPSPSPSP